MSRRLPTRVTSRPDTERVATEPDFDWSWAGDSSSWVSPTIDTGRPSIARLYDYLLGGKDHYGIDRDLARQLSECVPDLACAARSNREFVLRAVRVMAESGIRQFLDLGCGIPGETSVSVHEVARDIHPDARVAYVDHDPIVLAQFRAVIDGQQGLCAVLHDLREPSRVLSDPELSRVIRPEEPVGLVMGAVLHFVDQSIGPQVVGHYLSKAAPGSQVAFSVATNDGFSRETLQSVERIFRAASHPVVFRTPAQVEELFDGCEVLPPGITYTTRWHADGEPPSLRMLAGVAVKP